MRRSTVYDHGPQAFGVKLQLKPDDVDLLVGGTFDTSAFTPETQTQDQIRAL